MYVLTVVDPSLDLTPSYGIDSPSSGTTHTTTKDADNGHGRRRTRGITIRQTLFCVLPPEELSSIGPFRRSGPCLLVSQASSVSHEIELSNKVLGIVLLS